MINYDPNFRSDPSETLMTKMEDSEREIEAGRLSCSQRLLNEKIDTLNSKDKILGNEAMHLEGMSNFVKHENNEKHLHTIASDSTAEEECCTTESYVTERKDSGLGMLNNHMKLGHVYLL